MGQKSSNWRDNIEGLLQNYSKETVFKEPEVFQEDYIPKNLLHRDTMPEKIMDALLGQFLVALIGLPSSGKTATVLSLWRELERILGDDTITIYVNCRDKTKLGIITYILREYYGVKRFDRNIGMAYDELEFQRKERGIKDVYLCFDEYDFIATRLDASNDLLYHFGNTPNYHVVVIANTDEWYDMSLDARTKSRLPRRRIYFDQYNQTQIADILNEKLEMGLTNNQTIITNDELELLVEISIEDDDYLRLAIKTLGRMIDKKLIDKRIFNENDIRLLIHEEKQYSMRTKIESLHPKYKRLLQIIKTIETNRLRGNKMYQYATRKRIMKYWNDNLTYKNNEYNNITERTFWNYINYLKEFGYVKITEKDASGHNHGRPEHIFFVKEE